MKLFARSLFVLPAFMLFGCSIQSLNMQQQRPPLQESKAISQDENEITREIKGSSKVHFAKPLDSYLDSFLGKRDGGDCSGFISVLNSQNNNIYFDEAMLNSFFTSKNKSQAIYNLYKKSGRIFTKGAPRQGDLLFFVNTFKGMFYNKKSDKYVTHVGVVRDVGQDGTVRFLHHTNGKIKEGYVNVHLPNTYKIGDKEINSYIVRCPKKAQVSACLASTRFIGFGALAPHYSPKQP